MTTKEKQAYFKEYYKNNKEKLKLASKNYYANNQSKIKKYYKKSKKRIKEYRKINKPKYDKLRKEWEVRNGDKMTQYSIKYRKTNKNKLNKKAKIWRKANRKRINIYEKEKAKNDPLFKLGKNIKTRISNLFRDKGYSKKSRTRKILGCEYNDFKIHLESKFENWMNWDNYGLYNGQPNYGWDIDHIVPKSKAKTEAELIELSHYSNLQPLCSYINRCVKKNRI